MLGKKNYMPKMFHSVTLEKLVPKEHELRRVAKIVDFSFIRERVRQKYSWTGQPSVDPEVIIKMLFIGYYYGILSERKLVKQIQTDLSYRWFLGYDLDEQVPNHSVLSKARSRYGLEVFQALFDKIVEQCIEAKIVGGEQAFIDATLIQANASYDKIIPRIKVLNAVEYTKEMMGRGQSQRGTKKKVNDCKVSSTDPDATLRARHGQKGGLYYQGHYLVDSRKRVIIGATTSDTRQSANKQPANLILKMQFRHRLKLGSLSADTEYGTQNMYHFLFSNGIKPLIPMMEPPPRDGQFCKNSFEYNEESDTYTCPTGKSLIKKHFDEKSRSYAYMPLKKGICKDCIIKPQCTGAQGDRQVRRLLYQQEWDQAKQLMQTNEYRLAMVKRKTLMESIFAEAKENHGLRRARFRGMQKVGIQVLWTATILNIKRLLKARYNEFNDIAKQQLQNSINYFYFLILKTFNTGFQPSLE